MNRLFIILSLLCLAALPSGGARPPKKAADPGMRHLETSFHLYDSLQKNIFNYAETAYNETRSAAQWIAFLEEHTGHKMDWDELRRICEESNKAMAYWDDCNHVLMQKPCVYHSLQPAEWGWTHAFHVNWPGDPEVTEFYKTMAENAAALYEELKDAVPSAQCIGTVEPYHGGKRIFLH